MQMSDSISGPDVEAEIKPLSQPGNEHRSCELLSRHLIEKFLTNVELFFQKYHELSVVIICAFENLCSA
jgi:hypothetical protein